jgi:hypothetical protein
VPTAAPAPPSNSEPNNAAAPAAPEPEPIPEQASQPTAPDQGAGPAAIRAVAPFRIRAGSLQILDVHGSGLRADHRAKVVPLRKREAAAGFTVTRYQLRSEGLLLVFVQVDGAVRPGKYALSLVDSAGAETNAFTIEVVTK